MNNKHGYSLSKVAGALHSPCSCGAPPRVVPFSHHLPLSLLLTYSAREYCSWSVWPRVLQFITDKIIVGQVPFGHLETLIGNLLHDRDDNDEAPTGAQWEESQLDDTSIILVILVEDVLFVECHGVSLNGVHSHCKTDHRWECSYPGQRASKP